jgi:hypothetical protein
MQITLKQSHIEAAIRDFVAKAGITFDVDEINFTAGRGKDGLIATVDLEDPFSAMLDKVADGAPAKPKAIRTMEARGEENIMPASEASEEEETPDQAPVSEEPEAPVPASKKEVLDSPFASDEPKADVVAAKEAAPKAGVSLFG